MKSQPHFVDVHVGQAIKYQRLRRRMTQSELGKRVGVSFQQIQKYERGSNRISAGKLSDIASAFGIDIQTFFEDIGGCDANASNTTTDDKSAPRDDDLTISLQGVQLNSAFLSIEDGRIRARLLRLVQVAAMAQRPKTGGKAD